MFTRMIIGATMIGSTAFGVNTVMDNMGIKATEAAFAQPSQQRIVIGLDLSLSNPLVSDKMYSTKVAQRVAEEIQGLAPRSEVIVRSFGSYDASSNPLRFNETISAKKRPDVVAKNIETLVANIPSLVDAGRIKGQGRTNIIAFLENMTQVVDCSDGITTQFILLTDGVEESEYADLRNANARLPENVVKARGQCDELQILGLGQGLGSPSETQRLRVEWQNWATGDANKPFVQFVGLNDW